MHELLKRGLGAVLLTAGLLGAGCAGKPGQTAAGETGATDPAQDGESYLLQLGFIRGHLEVGVALYQAGYQEAALSHMKYPSDELYSDLEEAFTVRGAAGFAIDLEVLAEAVRRMRPTVEVKRAHRRVLAAMGQAAAGARLGPSGQARVAAGLVLKAAEEYVEAIDSERFVKPYEYQDAYGFTRVARSMLERLETGPDSAWRARATRMRQHLEELEPAWPALVPPPRPLLSVQRFRELAEALAAAAR